VFAGKAEFAFFCVKKEEKGVSFVIVCKQHVCIVCSSPNRLLPFHFVCVFFFFAVGGANVKRIIIGLR
jgi:hypothetical protein